MDDVERALRDLPEESPPPAIVLAAVRTFRYRAIATVAAIIAGVLLLGMVWNAIRPDNLGAEAASARNPTVVPILEVAEYDGIMIEVTEMVWDDGTGYLRFLAWDTGIHAEVMIEPVAITTSEGERIDVRFRTSLCLQNYTVPDGPHIERRTAGGWIKFDDPDHDPWGALSFEIELQVYPLEIVLEGGELGPFPTLTIRYEGLDLR